MSECFGKLLKLLVPLVSRGQKCYMSSVSSDSVLNPKMKPPSLGDFLKDPDFVAESAVFS